ncbi:hypothetical protein [uncultured Jatrophihabitans sp.]|uniref:hypothetical protein n=1 Tax=uncultured Jatrophihabitans sp. TaxID=1610747 RepID=UPI0035CABE98
MELERIAVQSIEDLAEEFAELPVDVVARAVCDHADGLENGALADVRGELDAERQRRT